ncbi:MAG: hypothetical protein ACJ75B_09975 [Flavisolibacter sp.]
MNAKKAFINAESYYKTTALIHKEMFKNKEFIMPFYYVRHALVAFSCELFLKSLFILEGKEYNHTHGLKDLFGNLSKKAQSRIAEIYDKSSENSPISKKILKEAGFPDEDFSIESILKKASGNFVKFRYKHEEKKIAKKTYHLHFVLKSIREYIIELNPGWPIITMDSDF